MRALTLHQPWATLMALGVKRFETRSWAPAYRGPLAIHAGVVRGWQHTLAWGDETYSRHLEEHGYEVLEPLPGGCILAVGTLVSCERITQDMSRKHLAVDPDDWELGDWTVGRFAWRFRLERLFEAPIPCRGYQGLWTPPEGLIP